MGKEKEIPAINTKEQIIDNNLKQQTMAFIFEDIVKILKNKVYQ